MIVGYGIDIMSTERIRQSIARYEYRFLNRVYTDYEIEFAKRRNRGAYQFYTALWAAKEATMKALGTGARRGVRFKDIEIHHERSGKPFLLLYGVAKEHSKRLGADNMVLSLSHLEDIVVASVILEKTRGI
jgi:holo-[acyl-carrier protein] synthase